MMNLAIATPVGSPAVADRILTAQMDHAISSRDQDARWRHLAEEAYRQRVYAEEDAEQVSRATVATNQSAVIKDRFVAKRGARAAPKPVEPDALSDEDFATRLTAARQKTEALAETFVEQRNAIGAPPERPSRRASLATATRVIGGARLAQAKAGVQQASEAFSRITPAQGAFGTVANVLRTVAAFFGVAVASSRLRRVEGQLRRPAAAARIRAYANAINANATSKFEDHAKKYNQRLERAMTARASALAALQEQRALEAETQRRGEARRAASETPVRIEDQIDSAESPDFAAEERRAAVLQVAVEFAAVFTQATRRGSLEAREEMARIERSAGVSGLGRDVVALLSTETPDAFAAWQRAERIRLEREALERRSQRSVTPSGAPAVARPVVRSGLGR
jgi:hypothetical protein